MGRGSSPSRLPLCGNPPRRECHPAQGGGIGDSYPTGIRASIEQGIQVDGDAGEGHLLELSTGMEGLDVAAVWLLEPAGEGTVVGGEVPDLPVAPCLVLGK